ncbi:MAG: hypothetical protein NC308_04080 [Clostridium sp.]|nr:hypothetical protein [Bacteroides sp.]MCM1198045.1 hypothetical protein [Clostridium sp.]
MQKYLKIFAVALITMSCSKGGFTSDVKTSYGNDGLEHGMIVLGDRLDNPYTTANVRKAFAKLYPTKAASAVSSTNYYVRFLPKDQAEFDMIAGMGVEMLDHPVDFEVVKEGDYYHDPALGEDSITWQYAVVPLDFNFPNVKYEIIDECFIADNAPQVKAADEEIDWDEVEKESFMLTGNGRMIAENVATKASSVQPSGRITIVDEHANGGQPFGLAGVKVSCNTFVKFSSAYTDRDGYYTIPKKFSAKLRYRLVFKNEKGFAIGFNLILVPASFSTLGKAPASGMSYTVTKDSDGTLFRRSAANNAAYDYYSRCSGDDMGIALPPANLRIWLFKNIAASSAVMIHHGAIVSSAPISAYLGHYAALIKLFAPDITIGTKDNDSYRDIYDSVCHELAHASHFSKVGTAYWNKYIQFIATSFLETGGKTYGTGDEDLAGYCEVGEMWGYYVESMMHKERYGGSVPDYGTGYWFYPQIFRYLEDRGVSRSEIFAALTPEVIDRSSLQQQLIQLYPKKKTVIEQVFNRYR